MVRNPDPFLWEPVQDTLICKSVASGYCEEFGGWVVKELLTAAWSYTLGMVTIFIPCRGLTRK